MWHRLCLVTVGNYRREPTTSGGSMRSTLKTLILAPALLLAAACSKDNAADPSLNNDLSLAAQANPNMRLDSITAAERMNSAEANSLRAGSAPAAVAPAPARRTTASAPARRR